MLVVDAVNTFSDHFDRTNVTISWYTQTVSNR